MKKELKKKYYSISKEFTIKNNKFFVTDYEFEMKENAILYLTVKTLKQIIKDAKKGLI